jgi:hypothetical protein
MQMVLQAMVRKCAAVEETQIELKRRIALCDDQNGRCRGCGIPIPRAATPKNKDDPNWIVAGLPDLAPGCFGAILKIVDQMRAEYELMS